MSGEEQFYSEPPSYEDAISPAGSRTPQSRREAIAIHSINLIPQSVPDAPLSPAFPKPDGLWQSRGVTHGDWRNFTAGLTAARNSGSTESTCSSDEFLENQLQRMREVLATWNKSFFEPRGCQVLEAQVREHEVESPSGRTVMFTLTTEKVGLQVGNRLFGIARSRS